MHTASQLCPIFVVSTVPDKGATSREVGKTESARRMIGIAFETQIYSLKGYMMRRRLSALLAVKAVALLALCAGAPTLAAPDASAAPGGHHPATRDDRSAHRRADTADRSTSVGIHVLPRSGPTGPATGGPGGTTSTGAGGGGSATAHSRSDNAVSADIHSGGEHGTSSHNGDTSSHHGYGHQNRGNTPWLSGPHRGREHGTHRPPGHGGHRHGHLPFTGRNTAIIASAGAVAVLVGAALLWMSSRRRKRAA